MSDLHASGGDPRDTLRDRAYWESLSLAELRRTIENVRRDVSEHQAHLDEAQRFLEAMLAIQAEKRAASREMSADA